MEKEKQNGSLSFEIDGNSIYDMEMKRFFMEGINKSAENLNSYLKSSDVSLEDLIRLENDIYTYYLIYETYLKQKKGI